MNKGPSYFACETETGPIDRLAHCRQAQAGTGMIGDPCVAEGRLTHGGWGQSVAIRKRRVEDPEPKGLLVSECS